MVTKLAPSPANTPALDTIWFTRCPVPTATGLAYKLGWLDRAFEADSVKVQTLQESGRDDLRRHHYDHDLASLIREGGNMLALGARAQGAPTRLVGLTWIDERQSILVRPDSDIRTPADLKGRRLALPTYTDHPIPEHLRGSSIARGMSLHGYKGALASVGLSFDDVALVEVASRRGDRNADNRTGWALQDLADGKVDAVYVKGAAAVDAARRHGVVVGIDLDKLPEKRFRVNNGTPRPITVHQSLIDNHFDLLVKFLAETLRAAEWAKGNLEGVCEVLGAETRGSAAAVEDAYRDGFHLSLHPDLSYERVALFAQQKTFLWLHGFSDRDFSLDAWIDRRPLEAAYRQLDLQQAA
ncbi:ABC transporter substrate-binding protein [Phenylobacterium sp. LjRoot219]|uniref:ABC transporter substrate-binding protein n=1 Tax=Phenylobacterium sp. LjRoot219 TaxID=3342283 RepID=UPI003ECF6A60